MNVLAVPFGIDVIATKPFIYLIKQIRRKIMIMVSGKNKQILNLINK
mgnify:CR=1 FL=1